MTVTSEAGQELHSNDVQAIDELRGVYQKLRAELAKVIVGQDSVVEQLSICLFARGHSLLMGVPSLVASPSRPNCIST